MGNLKRRLRELLHRAEGHSIVLVCQSCGEELRAVEDIGLRLIAHEHAIATGAESLEEDPAIRALLSHPCCGGEIAPTFPLIERDPHQHGTLVQAVGQLAASRALSSEDEEESRDA